MEWTSSIVGFGFGLLSSLLVVKISDRLRAQKVASDKFLSPMYAELGDIRIDIERKRHRGGVPAGGFEVRTWEEAVTRGLSGKIGRSIRGKMEHLHNTTFPAYDSALHEAQIRVDELCRRWGSQYGVSPHAYDGHMGFITGWGFLTAERFEGISESCNVLNNVLNIDNTCYLSVEKLREEHLTLDQFLQRLWSEAQNDPAMIRFRAVRGQVLSEVENVMQYLAGKIQI